MPVMEAAIETNWRLRVPSSPEMGKLAWYCQRIAGRALQTERTPAIISISAVPIAPSRLWLRCRTFNGLSNALPCIVDHLVEALLPAFFFG